jgi:cell division transport system permease protein
MSLKRLRGSVRSWGRRQLYSFFSSLGTLLSNRLGTMMTVMVLGVAMLLPLGLYVTVENLRAVDLQQEQWGTLTVFLQPGEGEDRALALEQRIRSETGADVELVSPAQGMTEFSEASGFGAALEMFDENPLPWVLLVTPSGGHDENLGQAAARLGEWLDTQQEVDLVQVDYKWLQRLAGLLQLGDAFVSVLTVLFSLAVAVVIANTIRLDVASRAEEIQVLSLVGAGNGFIRQPFLYSGFWYGLLGAFLALLLLNASLLFLQPPLERVMDAYGNRVEVRGLGAVNTLLVLLIGGLLGLTGAWISVQRYLRQLAVGGLLGRR